MQLVNTSLKKLGLHLTKFSPLLIENNPNKNIRLSSFEFIDLSHENFSNNCLYIVNLTNLNHIALLKKEANFLILTNRKQEISQHLGSKTNALIISDSIEPLVLSNQIQGFFSASSKFHEFSYSLIQELEHENKLINYLNLLAEYLSHPVALIDASLHMMAHSDSTDVADPGWTALLSNTIAEDEGVQKYFKRDLPDLLPRLGYPIFYENATLPRRIVYSIKVENAGTYLLEILENQKAFDNSDLAFTFLVSSFLQFFMANRYHNFRQDNVNTLIEEIISGKETDTFRMYNRMEALPSFLDTENFMLMFYPNSNIGFVQLLHSVHELRELSHCTTILLGSEIIMIFPAKDYKLIVNKKILPYLKVQKNFKCCLSAKFNAITSLKAAHEQCLAARNLGTTMDISGNWYEYDAYRELHFATKYLSDEDIDFFCISVAKDIVQHDRMHQTRYAYTLLLYLKNFKNAATVATIMHTHRNTMFYRLNKIAEQFDLNYDNPIQMNNLSLSFNILANKYPDIFT